MSSNVYKHRAKMSALSVRYTVSAFCSGGHSKWVGDLDLGELIKAGTCLTSSLRRELDRRRIPASMPGGKNSGRPNRRTKKKV